MRTRERAQWGMVPVLSALLLVVAMAPSLAAQQCAADTMVPGARDGPFARAYHPEHAPAGPDQAGFPSRWLQAYGNAARQASDSTGRGFPSWLRDGVAWRYAEARAWPLENSAPFGIVAGDTASALTTITQWMGNTLNVTPVGGMIYAESDDQFVYALNARTGHSSGVPAPSAARSWEIRWCWGIAST